MTLLTATRDVDHSQAAVLAQLLRSAEPAEPEPAEPDPEGGEPAATP